jgi:hypothetical protein
VQAQLDYFPAGIKQAVYHNKKNAFSYFVKYTEYAKFLLIFLHLLSTCCYVINMSVTKVRDVFPVMTLPLIKEYIVQDINELHEYRAWVK